MHRFQARDEKWNSLEGIHKVRECICEDDHAQENLEINRPRGIWRVTDGLLDRYRNWPGQSGYTGCWSDSIKGCLEKRRDGQYGHRFSPKQPKLGKNSLFVTMGCFSLASLVRSGQDRLSGSAQDLDLFS